MAATPDTNRIPQDIDVDVVVVGGGLAGLIAGAHAARGGASVAIVDHAPLGGRARSTDRDGYRLNQGPRAVYLAGALAEVLKDLGVAFPGGPPWANRSSVVYRGEVHRLPATPALMVRSSLVSLRDKARMGLLLQRLPKLGTAALAECSSADWIANQGFSPAGTDLVAMLMRIATYCPDLSRLSADAGVAQLRDATTGPGVRYIHGGWQHLVDSVRDRAVAAGTTIVADAPVRSIEQGPAGFRVVTDGPTVSGRAVIVAAGSPRNADRLLPGAARYDGLGPDATAACIDLGLASAPAPLALFGMDEPLYLSTHCPPADLAPPGGSVVHLMRYGTTDAALDQDQLWAFAGRAGIQRADVVVERVLPHMTVAHALPVPEAGGLASRPTVAVADLPGAFIAGDWVGDRGLLADASAASGRDAATAALAHLAASGGRAAAAAGAIPA